MTNRLAIAALALTLGSCGSVADLTPRAGTSLPQKPALARDPLTAEQLLELPPIAKPRRVDELTKRGDVRQADPFELPPPDGPTAPAPAPEDNSGASTSGPDNEDEPRS